MAGGSRAPSFGLVERGEVTLVHALPEPYFRKEHIAGAIQLDHERVGEQALQRLPDKDAGSSPTAPIWRAPIRDRGEPARRARLHRCARVRRGIADWIEAGLPVEGEVGAAV